MRFGVIHYRKCRISSILQLFFSIVFLPSLEQFSKAVAGVTGTLHSMQEMPSWWTTVDLAKATSGLDPPCESFTDVVFASLALASDMPSADHFKEQAHLFKTS